MHRMAKSPSPDYASQPLHRSLSTPRRALVNMLLFLVLVGIIVALIIPQLWAAVLTNPVITGLILFVEAFGIIYCFGQVIRLYPEIRWVNGFRIADPGLAATRQPTLLAPMATMLRDRTGVLSLSTTSMRSIMDSIGSRLDEARDTGRYLVGLLVFLGLLGTFWGLLDTISSVGKAIGALDSKASDSVAVFEELKNGLAAPLKGMGTAFSASLLGLSGSLVLGFLELQASHAHARFYNELEEWLSGITDLSHGAASAAGTDQTNRQMYAVLYDMQRVLGEMANRMEALPSNAASAGANGPDPAVRELASGVDQLVRQMRAEQKVVREWVDEQSAQQSEVAAVLKDLASNAGRR
jgi:hypothetical protein